MEMALKYKELILYDKTSFRLRALFVPTSQGFRLDFVQRTYMLIFLCVNERNATKCVKTENDRLYRSKAEFH